MSDGAIQQIFEAYERRGPGHYAEKILAGETPLYIYGAGNMGRNVCRVLKAQGRAPAAFLDRAAVRGSVLEGTPVLAPDAVPPGERRRARVFVAVWNTKADIAAIRRTLLALGYTDFVSLVSFHRAFAAELGDQYWLGSREIYSQERALIEEAFTLFSDEPSRALYAGLLRWRLLEDDFAQPDASLDDQYFPEDLPPCPSPLRMADCGAFDGDTLREIARRGLRAEAIAAFEPDPVNFGKLAETARTLEYLRETSVTLYPCGVGRELKTIQFAGSGAASSRATDEGNVTTVCVPLDDALAAFRPNFIKMDIEGDEPDALRGAENLVKALRPRLALCVYHRPDHLWKIPLQAARLLPNARHYLRQHGYCGFDTVYYALP
ncbi:MAG TPA: FkbM family methyltransferase [Candidatus Methylacidiphilales bacterium]|jgi:FkbM family methyltransferase|nr:FkbM family methyltransferase [Candidatus Methylacidiphilales bacterium]